LVNGKNHYSVEDENHRFLTLIKLFLIGDRVQFEKDCRHIQSTISDFLAWTNRTLSNDHPLNEYSNEEYFAYADYMHLPELFGIDEHPLINVCILNHFKKKKKIKSMRR
jgi:hypothetical protein